MAYSAGRSPAQVGRWVVKRHQRRRGDSVAVLRCWPGTSRERAMPARHLGDCQQRTSRCFRIGAILVVVFLVLAGCTYFTLPSSSLPPPSPPPPPVFAASAGDLWADRCSSPPVPAARPAAPPAPGPPRSAAVPAGARSPPRGLPVVPRPRRGALPAGGLPAALTVLSYRSPRPATSWPRWSVASGLPRARLDLASTRSPPPALGLRPALPRPARLTFFAPRTHPLSPRRSPAPARGRRVLRHWAAAARPAASQAVHPAVLGDRSPSPSTCGALTRPDPPHHQPPDQAVTLDRPATSASPPTPSTAAARPPPTPAPSASSSSPASATTPPPCPHASPPPPHPPVARVPRSARRSRASAPALSARPSVTSSLPFPPPPAPARPAPLPPLAPSPPPPLPLPPPPPPPLRYSDSLGIRLRRQAAGLRPRNRGSHRHRRL